MLGLIAWILPIISLMRAEKLSDRGGVFYIFFSFSACSIALLLQQYYNDYLVQIGDWSALMDTTGAVSIVSMILLVVTIVLNAASLLRRRN
ncbi:MAG: hypothetical protein ACOYI4_02160 [Christensenellales bacterium]